MTTLSKSVPGVMLAVTGLIVMIMQLCVGIGGIS